MTQATDRAEGGLTPCRDRSRQFRTFTQKELETTKEAQKLLGAPNIEGGGVPGQGAVVERVKGGK